MQMTLYQTPNSIVTVGNVGGSFSTSGTAATQFWNVQYINSNGSTKNAAPYYSFFDLSLPQALSVCVYTSNDITLNSTIGAVGGYISNHTFLTVQGASIALGGVGVSRLTFTIVPTATNGETVYSFLFGQGEFYGGGAFDANFVFAQILTTPISLPSTGGHFAATIVFQIAFVRMLTN
jgi:hypothetical protein